MTWDRRIYFPSEGRRAEDFFALKIRRLRPGANPRTGVPKASTLPLDHRSGYVRRIQFSIILPTTSLSHLPIKFTTKILCAFISSPTHAKCPAHLTVLNFVILVTSGEEDQKVGNSFRPYAMKVTQLILQYQN